VTNAFLFLGYIRFACLGDASSLLTRVNLLPSPRMTAKF